MLREVGRRHNGSQFTCFTSKKKIQVLTPEALRVKGSLQNGTQFTFFTGTKITDSD
jgi:hypothetical protein